MRCTFLTAAAFLIAGSVTPASAQAPGGPASGPSQVAMAPGEVSGSVVDAETKAPVQRASIAVRTKADGALVTGGFAGADGSFRIAGLRPGAYTVRVTYIGYGPRAQEFTITPTSLRASVGAVAISRVAVALQGVEVTAERATMTIEPDRNTYRSKDVAPAASNASDVLDAVPSVQVDSDGKVSLRGNENVAVQINGRPTPIRGQQLGAYLKQLPATIVERIEVVPNPSAKYDPEGMAGIINIVLKENTDLGVSGGFTMSGATADRYNGSGNIGYQSGPLTLFTSYGYNADQRGLAGINDRERLGALSVPLSFTEQDITGRTGEGGHNVTATADYKLNKRDVITNSLILNRRNGIDESLASYTELNASRDIIDRYNRVRDTDSRSSMLDYTLAFKRTLEPRKHELATELRFNRRNEDDLTTLWRQPLGLTGSTASRLEEQLDDTDAISQQLTAQVDYTRTLAARTKLETGYKGNGRWLDRDYLVKKDALGTGEWVRSNLSNDFDFDEQVQAVYGVLSHGLGKFDLQGGLRAEYASRDFSLASTAESYPFDYTSLFPSGVALYKLSDATQAKLSYSRRIRRPGTQELNPFPNFFDAQNVMIGNPRLNPEYTDAFELGLSRSGKLGTVQLSPFYRRTTDVIRVIINTADVIDGRDVTTVRFQNLETSNSWGTDLNGSVRLGKRFNGFASFNIFKMVTDGGSESALSSDAVNWTTRLNGTATVTPSLTLQAGYFYRAPMNIERGRFSSFQMMNVAVRQKLMNDKATVSLRFVDPFNTNGMRIQVGDSNIVQITERKFGVRGTFLTFQYNFGQAPKIRQPQPQQQEPSAGFPSG